VAGDHGGTPKKSTKPPVLIGWREWAGFPDLGVKTIIAKMDTGAKSSAIHAFNIDEVEIDGKRFVEFCLHPAQRKNTPEIFCQAPVMGQRTIRSSNGQTEKRYVIQTRLKLGRRVWKIELTLTNREAMDYRLLLGRDAVRRRFIVDPNASYLLGGKSDQE
jgi:hypothetical protein